MPYTTATGRQYDRLTPAETFEATLGLIGYDAFRAEQQRLRRQGRYLGIGISTYVEPTAGAQGPTGVEVATIRIEPGGKVNVLMGTGSHGHSLETTMIQVVADNLVSRSTTSGCCRATLRSRPTAAGRRAVAAR